MLLWFLTSSVMVFATHNRAGYISYTHVSGLTYEVEITTLTVPDSPADRPTLILDWGDGLIDTIARTNGGGNGVIIEPWVKENKYVFQHTYSALGAYVLTMEDPNRNGGIINVPNSINIPFTVQSELHVTGSNDSNNSAKPTASIRPAAQVDVPFQMNLAFYDPDADFLTFELNTPLGENGQPISGYIVPSGVSVNPLNGDFVWDSPQTQGEYNFAVIVKEYRNTELVGSVIVDFQIVVFPDDFTGFFSGTSSWPLNSTNDFAVAVEPYETVELNLTYTDSGTGNVQLEAFGEPFLFGNAALFELGSSEASSQSRTFGWTPTTDNLRCAPYIVSFRGTSGGSSGSNDGVRDISLLIYVHDEALQANPDCVIYAGIESETKAEKRRTTLYPNPVGEVASITFSDESIFDFTFEVFDGAGQFVCSEIGSTNETMTLNKRFSSGLYFYRVSFSDGKMEQGKMVVQ